MKIYIVRIMLAGSLLAPAIFAQTTTPAPQAKPANKVNTRRENQQNRIAQGVKSGQLNAKETARLESKEHKLNQEIHNDRAAHSGKLTAQEKRQVNRRQNRVSQQIYKQKHDSQTQPK